MHKIFYKLCGVIVQNWKQVRDTVLIGCHDPYPSTDVVYALAYRVIDPTQKQLIDYPWFKFIHNKPAVQGQDVADLNSYLMPMKIGNKILVGSQRLSRVWHYVDKTIPDYKMHQLQNTYIKPSQIDFTIESDADVYTTDGILLVRFRKNKLDKKKIDEFYDAVINFAKQSTSNRGSTSGSNEKNVGDNPKIMSNIFGYFDRFSPSQKAVMTKLGISDLLQVRETRFNMDFPDDYKKRYH
jgi:hypothetical protein